MTRSRRKRRRLPYGELALDILLSETRILAARAEAELGFTAEVAFDPLTCWPQSLPAHKTLRASAKAARKALIGVYQRDLEKADPRWAREDAKVLLDKILLENKRGLIDWLDLIVDSFDIDIYFARDEPRVAQNSIKGWLRAIQRIDPDILVCHMLAKKGFADDIDQLNRWGLITRISERDLDQLMRRKVSDLHVHIGGGRNGTIAWLAIITGEIPPNRLQHYSTATLETLRLDPSSHRKLLHERFVLEELAGEFTDCLKAANGQGTLGQGMGGRFKMLGSLFAGRLAQTKRAFDEADIETDPADRDRLGMTRLEQGLLAERTMLAQAFDQLANWRQQEQKGELECAGTGAKTRQYELACLEHALDCYIYAKCTFLRRHTQPLDTNPGLGKFRSYFGSVEPIWHEGPRTGRVGVQSPRVMARDDIDKIFAMELGRNIKRAELRLGPLASPAEYVQFLQRWGRLRKVLKLDSKGYNKGCDIRFAIHFTRSLSSRSGSSSANSNSNGTQGNGFHNQPLAVFLRRLDRNSAILHSFRVNIPPHLRHLASQIARIDFAGQERDIPLEQAAFAMNLLRGIEDAVEDLEVDGRCDPQLHESWKLLARRGNARQTVDALNLGLTCHAGEDFAHPLEGIYAMACAVRALYFRTGDSIGHGLAAGTDVGRFLRDRGGHILIRKGRQFDMLIWLHVLIMRQGQQNFGVVSRRLEDQLWELAAEIYGSETLPPSLFFFDRLARSRRGPVPPGPVSASQSGICRSHHGAELDRESCSYCGSKASERLFCSQCGKKLRSADTGSNTSDSAMAVDSGQQPTSNKNGPRDREAFIEQLRAREFWDQTCLNERNQEVPLMGLIKDLEPAIEWAQSHLLKELTSNGIILEFNPSSNWRVSGQGRNDAADIPFNRILQALGDSVLATINTDNPGVLATRIENEYAIVFDALLDLDFSRTRAIALLNRLRRTGLHEVYWPRVRTRPTEDALQSSKIGAPCCWPGL